MTELVERLQLALTNARERIKLGREQMWRQREKADDHFTIADALIDGVADQLSSDLSSLERMEQIISAWAFAHNIDGAARNDLFARLRQALSPVAPEREG